MEQNLLCQYVDRLVMGYTLAINIEKCMRQASDADDWHLHNLTPAQ